MRQITNALNDSTKDIQEKTDQAKTVSNQLSDQKLETVQNAITGPSTQQANAKHYKPLREGGNHFTDLAYTNINTFKRLQHYLASQDHTNLAMVSNLLYRSKI